MRRPKNLDTREQKLSGNEYRRLLEKHVEKKKEEKRRKKIKGKERTKKNDLRPYSTLCTSVSPIKDFRMMSLVSKASLLGSASELT